MPSTIYLIFATACSFSFIHLLHAGINPETGVERQFFSAGAQSPAMLDLSNVLLYLGSAPGMPQARRDRSVPEGTSPRSLSIDPRQYFIGSAREPVAHIPGVQSSHTFIQQSNAYIFLTALLIQYQQEDGVSQGFVPEQGSWTRLARSVAFSAPVSSHGDTFPWPGLL